MNKETHDVIACWKKVSAAAEMKTAIRKLCLNCEMCIFNFPCSEHREVVKAMEAFANAG